MTRPCFTQAFLLAALAGSLVATGTALCQPPAGEDYDGPGYYRTCPFTEEDSYRDQDTSAINQQAQEVLNQDLAGRAVVAVLEDPATNDEDVPSQMDENELDGYADEKTAEQTQTIDDPWAYARYGYDYHYGSSPAEANETASEGQAAPETADDPWQDARDGYDYDYSSANAEEQQEADDDSQMESDSDYGIYYGDPCSEEIDYEANHEQTETESVAATEPVDDSWKAARYRYIYGMQGNDDVADMAEEAASEYASEYDDSSNEYKYDAAYGDAYSDAYDAATTNDEVVEDSQPSACEMASEYESEDGSSFNDYENYENPCDDSQMSDEAVEETAASADALNSETQYEDESPYNKYGYYDNPCNDYRIEATDGAWYDTADDNAEAVTVDVDESSETSTIQAECETAPTFDGYGYEKAYHDWYDNAGDDAEAVEADADESTQATTTEVSSETESAFDGHGYEDAYDDWYDTADDNANAVEAEADESAQAAATEVSSETESAYDFGYGYEEAYGDWYDTAGDNAEAVEAEADESTQAATTETSSETDSAFDGYGYEEAYGDWYDSSSNDAEAVEAEADESTQAATTDAVIDSEPAYDPYGYEDYEDACGEWYDSSSDDAETVEAVAVEPTQAATTDAVIDSEPACDPYGYEDYEDAYGDYYDSSSDDVEAAEADEPANNQPTASYPYPYGYGYEYEYDWQQPGKIDSAELSRPNSDPLGDPTMVANLDFGPIAELSQQIVQATVGSDLADTVRTGLTGVTDRLSALAENTDLQQVWRDVRSSVATMASQDQQAVNANVFLLEFLFDEDESASQASSMNESPWMLEENFLLDESTEQNDVMSSGVVNDECIAGFDHQAASQTLVWTAYALDRIGVALQHASGKLEAYADSSPVVASNDQQETINR